MNERILVVEDDVDMRNMLVSKLMESFYEIIQAEDGEQAVAKYFQYKPQLILLDIMLPKMDGFEVMLTIQEKNESKEALPPIIILSNFEKPDYLAQAKALDVQEYLVKSHTEVDEICNRVKAVLSK